MELDLSKIVNAKVSSQLENLKKQIEDITKASTGHTTQQNDQLKQATALLKEQITLQAK